MNKRRAVLEMADMYNNIPLELLKAYDEKTKNIKLITHEISEEKWPMWQTLFNPNSSSDSRKIRNNLEKIEEIGFRVYEDSETGDIYLGLDGSGTDFISVYWEPLYNLIGLHWHTLS